MRRESRTSFAIAAQHFDTINSSMGVITGSINTLATQMQNNTHALLAQREEKMMGDQSHNLDIWIMEIERAIDKADTPELRQQRLDKLKDLEAERVQLCIEHRELDTSETTNILTGPTQAALLPPPTHPATPPGLGHLSMPPPLPTPATPSNHCHATPPTPATPPSNNAKRTEPTPDAQIPHKEDSHIDHCGAHIASHINSAASYVVRVICREQPSRKSRRALAFLRGMMRLAPTKPTQWIWILKPSLLKR